jgi:hypothetical protein
MHEPSSIRVRMETQEPRANIARLELRKVLLKFCKTSDEIFDNIGIVVLEM